MAIPSLSAASIIVVPWSTSTATPSISIFSMLFALHHALAMLDVILEFWPEVLDKTQHRRGSSITQGADGTAGNVAADISQQIEVFHAPLPLRNPLDHAIQPAGAFTARGALATGFLEEEIGQALQRFYHAGGLIHDNHGARTQAGSGF